MLAHLLSFVAAYLFLGFVAPLIIMLVFGPRSAFVRANAVESLNFNLTWPLYGIIGVILALPLIGFLILIALGIAYLVLVIIASAGQQRRGLPLADDPVRRPAAGQAHGVARRSAGSRRRSGRPPWPGRPRPGWPRWPARPGRRRARAPARPGRGGAAPWRPRRPPRPITGRSRPSPWPGPGPVQPVDLALQPASSTCSSCSLPWRAPMLRPMVPLKDEMLSRLAAEANVAQFVSFVQAPACRNGTRACAGRCPITGSPPPRRSAPCSRWPWPARSTSAASGPGRRGRPLSYGLDPPRRRPWPSSAPGPARACTPSSTRPSTSTTAASPGSPRAGWSSSPQATPPGRSSRRARSPSPTTRPWPCSALSTGSPPTWTAGPASGSSSAFIPWPPGSARPTPSSGSASRSTRARSPPGRPGLTGSAGSSGQGLRPTGRRPARPPGPGHHRGRPPVALSFGCPTGSGERWLRTCPAEPVPGRFLTQRGWRDPTPCWPPRTRPAPSARRRARPGGGPGPLVGRGRPRRRRGLLVEGVAGFGDDFMLARAAPASLPRRSSTTSAASAPGPPPPSARSASSGRTTATPPGSSSST